MNNKGYQITDEDIDAYILLYKNEEGIDLTREQALSKLHELQAGLHSLAHSDPDKLFELQKKIDKKGHSSDS